MTRLLATTALALFIVQGTALANEANKSASETTGAATAQDTSATLPQKITQDLKADGYTDVEVMPGSYVVSAKDKRGNAVTMFIGPHSMTMVKAIDNSDQTTGSGLNSDDKNMSSDSK